MTISVNYKGTSPTLAMGADSPDSAGKVYYRATVVQSQYLGIFTFADALQTVYAALQNSDIVIPISPAPVDDGSGAAVIDVVVAPQGMLGNSVGDLVNLINEASYTIDLQKLERVNLAGLSQTEQASQRETAAQTGATIANDNSISGKIASFFASIEADAKWIIGGIVVVALVFAYMKSKRGA